MAQAADRKVRTVWAQSATTNTPPLAATALMGTIDTKIQRFRCTVSHSDRRPRAMIRLKVQRVLVLVSQQVPLTAAEKEFHIIPTALSAEAAVWTMIFASCPPGTWQVRPRLQRLGAAALLVACCKKMMPLR